MRTELSLANILIAYRGTALTAGGMAVAILVLLAFAMHGALSGSENHLAVLSSAGVVGLAMLFAMVWGYYSLRRALVLAERQRRDVLAAFHHDALTDAFTRKHFLVRLREMVREADRSPVAYMQVDMDHLKAINDGSGHAAGDKALIRLVETARDVVPGAMIGRLGGDEFAIAIPGLHSKSVVKGFADQILMELDRPQPLGTREQRLSATMGIAVAS